MAVSEYRIYVTHAPLTLGRQVPLGEAVQLGTFATWREAVTASTRLRKVITEDLNTSIAIANDEATVSAIL